MNELSALGLSPRQEEEWRDFFASGRVFAVPLDRRRVRARLRAAMVVMVIAVFVLLLAAVTFVAVLVLHIGGPVTVLLLALLMLAAAIMALRFGLLRRRLRIGRGSGDDYLVVSAEGMRIAGHVDVPWTAVIGGVGFDDRGAGVPLLRGPAAAIERSAGRVQAEFVFGVRGVRALRDGAPHDLRALFEVIEHHGGIRLPLDTMVDPESVLASLAAICIAGRRAGVDVEVTADRSTIYTRTVALLGPEKTPPADGRG
ncbi:hypothetical protein [Microbacterium sp. 1.5R]|uniref:hypothetical protein n=1 Tax=Microbacterium sp. 1.5R TaxID=1916917 RepID=UPI0011A0A249|nr:hypothetical protein [Microbacterium sp. 1.5R]